MFVRALGTRGSITVCRPDVARYGGNTTCWEIRSSRVSETSRIVIDAGTGFYEFGSKIMADHGPNAVKDLNLLFTHYHNDHVNGLSMCPLMFVNSIKKHLFGLCRVSLNLRSEPLRFSTRMLPTEALWTRCEPRRRS